MTRYWDEAAAEVAEAVFDRLFKEKGIPDEVPEHAIGSGDRVSMPTVLSEAGLASSKSEVRRLIVQGGVKIDGEKITEELLDAESVAGKVVQVGKRRFVRLVR